MRIGVISFASLFGFVVFLLGFSSTIECNGPWGPGVAAEGKGRCDYSFRYSVPLLGAIYENNASYEGNFQVGERNGEGKYVSLGGLKYDGSWRNGVRDGKGIFVGGSAGETDESGSVGGIGICVFEGIWMDDVFSGPKNKISLRLGLYDTFYEATIVPFLNMSVYEGSVTNGLPNGIGKISLGNGPTIGGKFREGHLIGGAGSTLRLKEGITVEFKEFWDVWSESSYEAWSVGNLITTAKNEQNLFFWNGENIRWIGEKHREEQVQVELQRVLSALKWLHFAFRECSEYVRTPIHSFYKEIPLPPPPIPEPPEEIAELAEIATSSEEIAAPSEIVTEK
jgi:hypothetical protein